MTAPLSPEELAALRALSAPFALPVAAREAPHPVLCAGGALIGTARTWEITWHTIAAVNALPGLLATVAARDREIAALRDRLALAEARTAVPPPRDALPGLRALAASEAAADVLRLAAPEVLP